MKAQFIKKINTIANRHKCRKRRPIKDPTMQSNDPQSEKRIEELEVRIAFLEDTTDALNEQLAQIAQEFDMAMKALRMLNAKVEQMGTGESNIRDISEETPPPHY
jgi:SlyX protein